MGAPESIFRLDGKLALVTGASSGLGQHFVSVLAAAGARVALAARRVDKLQAMVNDLVASGIEARAFAMDVSDAASVTRAFDAISAWGTPDIVVNNAGVTVTKPALEQSVQDYDQVLDTNLKGCWLVATEAARRMVAARQPGSIINVASILAERVAGGVAPYAISKAGVLQTTKALALELARHRIRVNALLPGYVVTDLNRDFLTSDAGEKLKARIPSRRFGEMSDLDGPLLLLASDAGAAMSGSSIAVDGAHLVSSL
ncbi:MAG: SDR family NAD(P)-dependent oxidoreductase [Rhodoferax sp.]|jgi:NAD(P)-dependent dehydrogenase (short-subunit alcohol dehydrogenase family)|nr:SDR family NAD(P)-dependent oxidoreductase [Rhodoferax sp.]